MFNHVFCDLELCCEECIMERTHRLHNFIPFKESTDLIRGTLEDNVKNLENGSMTLENIKQKTEEKREKFQSRKEEAKKLTRQKFDEIREQLEKIENAILNNIDEIPMGEEKLDQLISDIQNKNNGLSSIIPAGKKLLNEWDNVKIAPDIAEEAISIIDKVKEIDNFIETSKETLSFDVFLDPSLFNNDINDVMQTISMIKSDEIKKVVILRPKGLKVEDVGPFFASFRWDKNDQDDKYNISVKKEGIEVDLKSSLECNENRFNVTTGLEPDTAYSFSLRAKRSQLIGEWSDLVEFKTAPATIENTMNTLYEQCHNISICTKALEQMKILARDGNFAFLLIGKECVFY